MTFADILSNYGLSMAEINRRYHIPTRTMQDWKAERREAPDYVLELLDYRIKHETSPEN